MASQYTSEIHRLLKLGDHTIVPGFHDAPEGLPIVMEEQAAVVSNAAVLENHFTSSVELVGQATFRLKNFLIYPVIFIVAFAFFFVALNFSSVVAQVQGYFAKPQDQEILGDQMSAYYQWIGGYYYAVGDRKLLDPNNDIDKDGLSNIDEFTMRTNPTLSDSDTDGFTDGIEIINNTNPWGDGSMTPEQKKLAASLDAIIINNRISNNVAANDSGIVAGTSTRNYDLNKPGRLSIPRLNLSVPLIWSKDPSDFDADLTKGVIHYPGTVLPGDRGTVYVSGHSSDYLWKKNPMHDVFAKLNFLKPGDDVFVDVYGLDGKVYNYRYQVSETNIYKPDDQTQFIDDSTNKLNLSTCWPIGTSTNRIVVSAVQVGL